MAELKVTRSGFLLLLSLICCFSQVLSLEALRPIERTVHNFEVDTSVKAAATHTWKKRSLRHLIVKRSNDDKCDIQEQSFLGDLGSKADFSKSFSFLNETKFSMSLTWAGENDGHILVVTTEEMFVFVKPSTLYLSTDDGRSFTKINERINNAVIRKENGLQKHPFISNKVYLIAHVDGNLHSDLYITSDGGGAFTHVEMPFLMAGAFMFHPNKTHSDFILAHETHSLKLFMSADGGKSWNKILDSVVSYRWSTYEKDLAGTIYAVFNDGPLVAIGLISGDNILKKSTDLGASWDTVRTKVYTFGMQGKFLYCSKITGEDEDQRLIEVSTDGGKTWNEAQLPTVTSDRFYSILDMTEGLIFMHVDNPGDTGHGTLFTSDATGLIFSESLVKHLYPNFRELTDFYKVKSMRGVYLASQLMDDNSIRTMITFDRGGEWKPVKRPPGVLCKDESKGCYLQIHSLYSIASGISAQPPLSVESAVGIILVHGHVADAIQKTPPDVFVSSDGGYNWIKALDGPHHYQIADQGGLLVAVPADTLTPNIVKFSTDEGHCWHTYQFTNESIVFTGLLTEPGNKAMSVALWGYGVTDKKWRVTVLHFLDVLSQQCGSEDYETWVAHGDSNKDAQFSGCLLGIRETFQRLKKDSWCYNGHAHEVAVAQRQPCPCTKSDYDCDYGYYRPPNSENCVRDPEFKGAELDICLRGHEEEIVSEGYHKVPGDRCQGGFKPPVNKLIELKTKCKEGDKSEILHEVIPNDPDLAPHSRVNKKHAQSGIIVLCVLLTVLLAALAMGFMLHRQRLKNAQVRYRYSVLNNGGDGDYDYDSKLDNSLVANTSIYEDSSDEDTTRGGTVAKVKVHSSHSTDKPTSRSYFDPFLSVEASKSASINTGGSTSTSRPPPQPKVRSYHDDSDDDLLE